MAVKPRARTRADGGVKTPLPFEDVKAQRGRKSKSANSYLRKALRDKGSR